MKLAEIYRKFNKLFFNFHSSLKLIRVLILTLIRHKPIQIEILFGVVKHLLEFYDMNIYIYKQVHGSKWGYKYSFKSHADRLYLIYG